MAAEPNNLLRHIRHTCAMLISVVLLTACQTSTPLLLPHRPSLSTSPLAPSLIWMISASALRDLQQSNSWPLVQRFFNQPQNMIIISQHQRQPLWLARWSSQEAISVTSIIGLEHALHTGLPPRVKDIVYDVEHWPFTPITEQQHPITSIATAATLAHQYSVKLIAAPATDLVQALHTRTHTPYATYLSVLHLPTAARTVDTFEIQAQGAEMNVAAYQSFVVAATHRTSNQSHSDHPCRSQYQPPWATRNCYYTLHCCTCYSPHYQWILAQYPSRWLLLSTLRYSTAPSSHCPHQAPRTASTHCLLTSLKQIHYKAS